MECKIMLMTHGKLAESLSATAELICGEKVAFKNMPEVLDMQEYKKFYNEYFYKQIIQNFGGNKNGSER